MSSPLPDSLRSVYFWFVLLLLLCLRKANRTRAAWAILAPPLLIYLLLGVAERQLNAYFVFHWHQYICSTIGDLLRAFALGVAVWLAGADLVSLRSRFLRFVLLFLFLLLAGIWQLGPNAWPLLGNGFWMAAYGVMVLVFLLGHAIVKGLLGWRLGPRGFRNWHAAVCLALGLGPFLVLGAIGLKLDRPAQLQSVIEQIRTWFTFGSALTLPWFVFFWFVLLARLSPFYNERLSKGFGLSKLNPQPGMPAMESVLHSPLRAG